MKITQRIKPAELILGLGIWLRGIGLDKPAIWYDEAFSLEMARLPLGEMIRAMAQDVNPPLWELILKMFVSVSDALVWIRLPSLLASIGSLWLLLLIMDEFGANRWQRIWVMALTLLPINLIQAQDARVYALFGLLYLGSVYMAITSRWLGMGALVGLMIYAHSMGAVFALGTLAVALYKIIWGDYGLGIKNYLRVVTYEVKHFRDIKKYLGGNTGWYATIITLGSAVGSWLGGVVLAIPSLFMMLFGGSGLDDHWIPDLSFQYFIQSYRQALFAQALPIRWQLFGLAFFIAYVLLSLAVTMHILMDGSNKSNPADELIVIAGLAFAVPLLAMITGSILISNVVYYRPLALLSLPLALWVGSATAPLEIRWFKLIMPGIMAVIILASLVGYDASVKGAELDQAAAIIDQGEGPILYASGTAAAPFDYYIERPGYIADGSHHFGLMPTSIQDALGFERLPVGSWAEWVVIPRDPILDPDIEADLDELISQECYQRIGQVVYWQAAPIEIYHQQRKCQ